MSLVAASLSSRLTSKFKMSEPPNILVSSPPPRASLIVSPFLEARAQGEAHIKSADPGKQRKLETYYEEQNERVRRFETVDETLRILSAPESPSSEGGKMRFVR